MSRSYRRHPCIWYEKMDKKSAAQALRARLKNQTELPKRSAYKKYDKSGYWNACSYWPKTRAIKRYHEYETGEDWRFQLKHFPTLESYLRYWYKTAKGK